MTWARKRYIKKISERTLHFMAGSCCGCGAVAGPGDAWNETVRSCPPGHGEWRADGMAGAMQDLDTGRLIVSTGYWCDTCWDDALRVPNPPTRWWWHTAKYLSPLRWNTWFYRGGDEYDRNTLAIRVPFGELVIAFGEAKPSDYLNNPGDNHEQGFHLDHME